MVNSVDGKLTWQFSGRHPFMLFLLQTLIFSFVLSSVFTLSFGETKIKEQDKFGSLRFRGRDLQQGERGLQERDSERESKNQQGDLERDGGLQQRETDLEKESLPSNGIITEDSSDHLFGRNLLTTEAILATGSTERDALVVSYIAGETVTNETLCDGEIAYFVKCSTEKRVVGLDFTDGYPLDDFLAENVTLLDKLEVLVLPEASISGSIPPWIGNLTNLKTLDLSYNDFDGSCPASIGKLTSLSTLLLHGNTGLIGTPEFFLALLGLPNLKKVDLSSVDFLASPLPPMVSNWRNLTLLAMASCNLTGPLPLKLSTCTKLQYLDLSANKFSGSIPLDYASMTKLKYLDLSENQLSGALPNITWKQLTYLALSSNNFFGSIPSQLLDCTALQEIHLANILIGGEFPTALVNLVDLTVLDMDGANFSGTLPSSISTLVKLEKLHLGNNSFTGSVPESWTSFKNLQSVFLRYNKLSGGFPLFLTLIESLSSIDLSYNQFSGAIPASIKYLRKSLTSLDLSYNEFEGPLPLTAISQLSNLEYLAISNNKLNGSLDGLNFTSLVNLASLQLDYNDLIGNIPESLVTCCENSSFSLSLYLSGNQLSGQLSPNVFKSLDFSDIRLADNDFSGPIPKMKGSDQLEYLMLQNNRFNGSIPAFGSSVSLFELNVSGNLLSGKIPTKFLPKDSISSVDLSNNLLEGPIPSDFGTYTDLGLLILRDNKFNGSIPQSLLNNTRINFLDLRSNQLTGPISGRSSFMNMSNVYLGRNFLDGSIPESIAKSSFLLEISLENNQFTGSLPSNFSSNSRLSSFKASNNKLNGGIPSSLGQVQTLMELDLDSNSLTGPFLSELGNLTNLLYLRLQKNLLSGALPAELGNLTKLSVLDLSSNAFTGNLPPQLAGLRNLTFFNVSNNFFNGSLPGGNLTQFSSSSYLNNTASLCGYPLTACPSDVKNSDSGLSTGVVIGISVGAASFGILLLLLGAFFIWHLRKYGPDGGELILYHKLGFPLSYRSILEATDNFGEANLLGVGGFGSVYRATLGDGQMEVAIKRLAAGSGQGLKELRAETKTLGSLRHRNLVTLIGSYTSRKEALLIYEFISGGDLDGYLNGQKKSFSDWQSRHYVLVGSARGFKYLHHDCQPAVIHRDIKPANILLDSEMEPRIADFGLAKELDIDTKSHLSTAVSGTVGYLAPEYVLKKRLTTKSDVYAFGVVILQILTGRRPTDKSIGESGLAAWVSLLWIKRAALDAVDPNLKLEEHEQGQLLGALKIGLMCTSRKPTDRPTMAQVVHLLENLDLFTADSMGEVGEEKVEKVVH